MARPYDFPFSGEDHPKRFDEEPARITDADAVPEWDYATGYLKQTEGFDHLETFEDQNSGPGIRSGDPCRAFYRTF